MELPIVYMMYLQFLNNCNYWN